jgi:hypothetical protein
VSTRRATPALHGRVGSRGIEQFGHAGVVGAPLAREEPSNHGGYAGVAGDHGVGVTEGHRLETAHRPGTDASDRTQRGRGGLPAEVLWIAELPVPGRQGCAQGDTSCCSRCSPDVSLSVSVARVSPGVTSRASRWSDRWPAPIAGSRRRPPAGRLAHHPNVMLEDHRFLRELVRHHRGALTCRVEGGHRAQVALSPHLQKRRPMLAVDERDAPADPEVIDTAAEVTPRGRKVRSAAGPGTARAGRRTRCAGCRW